MRPGRQEPRRGAIQQPVVHVDQDVGRRAPEELNVACASPSIQRACRWHQPSSSDDDVDWRMRTTVFLSNLLTDHHHSRNITLIIPIIRRIVILQRRVGIRSRNNNWTTGRLSDHFAANSDDESYNEPKPDGTLLFLKTEGPSYFYFEIKKEIV